MIKIRREQLNLQEQFNRDKLLIQRNIELCAKNLEVARAKAEEVRRRYGRKSQEYQSAYIEVQQCSYYYDMEKAKLKFIRPNNPIDISYRCTESREFCEQLRSVTSRDLDLRFHGTPIYFAEQIIKSGVISSSADRYDGYIHSTDPEGEFSVSDINTLDNTIVFHTDLSAYQNSLPCGCVFALFPADMEDEEYPGLMMNVNLKQNPEQLFGIFTTPENIERVKSWMQESELDPEKVFTFEQFKKYVQEQSELINSGEEHVIPTVNDINHGKVYGERGIEEIREITNSRSQKTVDTFLSRLKAIFDRTFTEEDERGER